MSFCKNLPSVKKFLRRLRGGSQAILAEASDGLAYVVKFTNNLQGPNLPFNEAMGVELYKAFHLPVPDWKPLILPDAFIDQNPECWLATETGTQRPEPGPCFGSLFLEKSERDLFEILPAVDFRRVRNIHDFWLAWLIDACAGHSDVRQAVFRKDADGKFTAFFVDHGHMFGGPTGQAVAELTTSRYWDWRIYPKPDSMLEQSALEYKRAMGILRVDPLWAKIKDLPDEWIKYSALRQFIWCMDRLSKPEFLCDLHKQMVDSIRESRARKDPEGGACQKGPKSVACPRDALGGLVPLTVA